MELWIILVIVGVCVAVVLLVALALAIWWAVRRHERRRERIRVRENRRATVVAPLVRTPTSTQEGFRALAHDAANDSAVQDINKSMRRLIRNASSTATTTSTAGSKKNFWLFDRSKLIGKLAFSQWRFQLDNVPVYTAAFCAFKLVNRSNQPIRVTLRAVFMRADGSNSDREACGVVFSPCEVRLAGKEATDINVDVMPLVEGVLSEGFFRVTAHSVESVSFAPYHLPFRIHGTPIGDDLKIQFQPDELEGGDRVGQGAAASVYKKQIARLGGSWVAVKRFGIVQATQEDTLDFYREVANMCRFHHPNVVTMLGVCQVFPQCCLVMEYLPLGSLDTLVRPPVHPGNNIIPMPWRYRVRLAMDGAKGLSYLHALSVLHRDVKDANFLVVSHDHLAPVVLKLADFSLSKHQQQQRDSLLLLTRAQSGSVVSGKGKQRASLSGLGSPQWRSVESFKGEQESVESDVWSFGVVMWQLASLNIPFLGQCPVYEIQDRVLEGVRPRDPDTPGMPAGYLDMIKSCWHLARGKRPTCANLVATLRLIQMQEGWAQQCNTDGVQWTTEDDDDDSEDDEVENAGDLSSDDETGGGSSAKAVRIQSVASVV
jgi:serine/threonine protein kinase